MNVYSLSSRKQILFLVFLDARTTWFHFQGRCRSFLCSWLNEMSKQLGLLQQVLKSVGPVCLLHTDTQVVMLAYLSNNTVVWHAT